MEEEWALIREFPNYVVSNQGRVMNEATRRVLRDSVTEHGVVKVGLVRCGRQYTRSVKLLVAEAFVEREMDLFDTPIHLDNDQANNAAANLVWRPRWFAWKYARQFEDCEEYLFGGLYLCPQTGETYESIYEIGTKHGLLFKDVLYHIWFDKSLFPSTLAFVMAK